MIIMCGFYPAIKLSEGVSGGGAEIGWVDLRILVAFR